MTIDPTLEAVVDRVAELLRLRVGLRHDSSLRGRLRRCIRDEATTRGQIPNAYANMLRTNEDAVQSLLNQVTVQETGFFRHLDHFHVIARDILPRLARPVTIWSAGCANGQEAFSLAMLLEELHVVGSVIATDLSTSALARTAAATYHTRELSGLSPDRLTRHLTRTNSGWRINDNLRRRVTTLGHNLIEPIPAQVRRSQLVLCRNVLIYFSAEHARTFLDRLADTMPGAEVFLGAAETMWSITDRYETVRVDETFYYRKRAATSPQAQQPNDGPLTGTGQARPPDRNQRAPVRIPANPYRAVTAGENTRENGIHQPPSPGPVFTSAGARSDTAEVAVLATTGHKALDEGDHRSAVVAFRKCVYLTPDNALAHLHLGLALEASGDNSAALRAFGSARRAILESGAMHDRYALGGYATAELVKLLDTKRQVPAP
jgi:chemotaxis protein methyltransferase CheR